MPSEEAAKDPEDPRLYQHTKLPDVYTNCAIPLGLEADGQRVLTNRVSISQARSHGAK